LDLDSYEQDLKGQAAQSVRREMCRTCAEQLQACGNALWAFGLVDRPERRALATVLQMGGGLARGSITMLEEGNWYGAAALSRQLVEVEYLVWLFGVDPLAAEAWLSATQDDLRKLYKPSAMRKRSGGRFRDQEYWSHCEIGGHPNPKAAFLLPDHVLPGDEAPLPTPEWMWVDLGQHLERLWLLTGDASEALGLADLAFVSRSRSEVESVLRGWHKDDACAGRITLPTGEAER